ncbi:MAG: SoxR reducing system RseC family protein [Deltaproteobacteria bacterium]|nr:SoxR reducing system RseC family protein [Deltaproteobacteria bacterium]MBW2353136.1 SoxR reducing system RseC family protein [Deltaproteobacteria bacterium]
MVTERGIIEDVTGQKTLVRISKSSACATCESRGSCEVSSGRSMLVEVANDLGGGKGDHVELSVPSGALLKLSLLVYILPIATLIGGAFAGAAVAGALGLPVSLASVLAGFLFMGITFYLLKRLDRSSRDRGKFQPRMTRIFPRSDHRQPDSDRSSPE